MATYDTPHQQSANEVDVLLWTFTLPVILSRPSADGSPSDEKRPSRGSRPKPVLVKVGTLIASTFFPACNFRNPESVSAPTAFNPETWRKYQAEANETPNPEFRQGYPEISSG
jgi:hypothetical protein